MTKRPILQMKLHPLLFIWCQKNLHSSSRPHSLQALFFATKKAHQPKHAGSNLKSMQGKTTYDGICLPPILVGVVGWKGYCNMDVAVSYTDEFKRPLTSITYILIP